MFGRYSYGKFNRNGPAPFGAGGGPAFVSLGGVSDVKNQSLAIGVDHTFSSTLLADFRFGWFQYHVNVLPFDFGTQPAQDAGLPGLNFDNTFTSGLPAFFINGDRSFNMGSGLGVNRCNCPLDENEKQWQMVGNLTKIYGNHSFKFGIDVRRAYNLRVPSDNHRSGELSFDPNRTSLNGAGGIGAATFLLGDVTHFARFVSTSTDARERQWRHFYYAQDTWRATPKLTLNYGLRLDVINPQTVNEAGNGGWFDPDTGEILIGGVGGISLAGNVKNHLNWAPRLGATYQLNDKTVIRGGYARTYDIGVFGSLFGHAVTQNLPVLSIQQMNAASNFDDVFNLAQGPPAPTFVTSTTGRFPLPNGVSANVLPFEQRPPEVDAFNIIVQRQLTDSMSFEVGYVANRGRNVFAGDGPNNDMNQPTLAGFPNVPQNERRPFFSGIKTPNQNLGGAFGLTQGLGYFCNCANNWYDSMQARFTRRFSGGYSVQANYTLQKAVGQGDDYFFWDPNLQKGVRAGTARTLRTSSCSTSCPSVRERNGATTGRQWRTLCWAAGSSTPITPSRAGFPSTSTTRVLDRIATRAQPAERERRHQDQRRPSRNQRQPVLRCHADWRAKQPLQQTGGRHVRQHGAQFADWAGLQPHRRVDLQARQVGWEPRFRNPLRSGQPVQQRQSRQPGWRDRHDHRSAHQRRGHQLDSVREHRSAAAIPVRLQVQLLADTPLPTEGRVPKGARPFV